MNKIITVEEALNCLGRLKDILRAGGVIGVPTDTIYGLACLARNKEALKKVYEIKGRDLAKPLAISVGNIEDLKKWSKVTVSEDVLRSLLPGPVTLVFDRHTEDTLPVELNPNTKSIGIRIPDFKFMIELAKECGEPVALTSANISAQPSSLTIQEFEPLWPHLDLVVDSGDKLGALSEEQLIKAKQGSTVIDLTVVGSFRIIRNGSNYESVLKTLVEVCKLEELK